MKIMPLISQNDDWIVNVLLSNGKIFSFMTEGWPQWGAVGIEEVSPEQHTRSQRCVIRRAEDEALWLDSRNAEPYTTVNSPEAVTSEKILADVCNTACEQMSDQDFARLIRR